MTDYRSCSRWLIGLGLITASGMMGLARPAQGHGAKIHYQIAPSVEVKALFDNGDPMANAQVTVFAPSDPVTPWQTGLTDGAGNFSFTANSNDLGHWEVQVRQAGHGDIITIPLHSAINPPQGSPATPANLPNGLSQKLLMTGLGLWGLLGTGLFFSRKPRAEPQDGPVHRSPPGQVDADTSIAEPI